MITRRGAQYRRGKQRIETERLRRIDGGRGRGMREGWRERGRYSDREMVGNTEIKTVEENQLLEYSMFKILSECRYLGTGTYKEARSTKRRDRRQGSQQRTADKSPNS